MRIAVITVLPLILGFIIFLYIPYSPVKTEFDCIVIEKTKAAVVTRDIFEDEDIEGLPEPLQRYFRHCGYLGKPRMSYMRVILKDVDFAMSVNKVLKIDYKQLNLVERPERFAYISSSLMGIPFEGLDSFENCEGSMRGKLAKVIPLFNQRGEKMDRACLATWLSECLMVPNAALQDFVKWEPIDDTHVGAVISWEGISAEGIFTFADTGELMSFSTGDRVNIDMEGKETKADWSALFIDYYSDNGILKPKTIQAVWHYQSGDNIYFNRNCSTALIEY